MKKLTEALKFSPDGIRSVEYQAGDFVEGRAEEIADSLEITKEPTKAELKALAEVEKAAEEGESDEESKGQKPAANKAAKPQNTK